MGWDWVGRMGWDWVEWIGWISEVVGSLKASSMLITNYIVDNKQINF